MRAQACLALSFVLAGCSVDIPDGRLRCGDDDDCPPGYDCRESVCWAPGGDAGSGDASADGGVVDGGVVDAGEVDGGLSEEPTLIACGARHSCALTNLGRVYCWGDDTSGQVGDDTTADASPITDAALVSGLPTGVTIESIALGGEFSCALDEGTAVYCWGSNASGQLGDPSVSGMASVPNRVMLGAAVVPMALAVGGAHACVIDAANRMYCWGANASGQLGDGTNTGRPTPVEPRAGSTFARVAAGASHTCAIDAAGALSCWGANWGMQLGTDDAPPGTDLFSSSNLPIPVALPSGEVTALTAMGHHTCALLDGTAHCWGWNGSRQLATVAPDRIADPTPIVVGGAVTAIAGGADPNAGFGGGHTCANVGGALSCWGRNFEGQLGRGASGASSEVPTAVASLAGVTALAAGPFHTCAIAAGVGYCWGDNRMGRLGIGTETNVAAPAAVRTLPSR